MAEVRGRLLLRSPMMREDALLCLDTTTLLFTQQTILLTRGGLVVDSGGADSVFEAASPPSGQRSARPLLSPSFGLEYSSSRLEADDSADEGAKDATAVAAAPPEEGQWTPLSPFLLARVCAAFLRNPHYGDVVSSSLQASESPALSIEEEGLFLRIPSKLGMRRCRVRVKHRQHVMPLFAWGEQLRVVNLVDPLQLRDDGGKEAEEAKEEKKEAEDDGRRAVVAAPIAAVGRAGGGAKRRSGLHPSIIVDSRADAREEERRRAAERKESERLQRSSDASPPPLSLSPPPQRRTKRRQHALALDSFDLPSFASQESLLCCAVCGSFSSTSAEAACPLCATAGAESSSEEAEAKVELDDSARKQLEDMKRADREKAEDERRRKADLSSLQLHPASQPASRAKERAEERREAPPSAAASDAATSGPPIAVNAAYAAALQSLGFSALRVEKALVYSANASVDAALQWLIAHADRADVDLPWSRVKYDVSVSSTPPLDSSGDAAFALAHCLSPPPQRPSPSPSSSAAPLPPTSSASSFIPAPFLRCVHRSSLPLGCVVDTYRAIKAQSTSSGAAPAAPPSVLPVHCDGCGASSAFSASPFLLCLHRDCKELHLCHFCSLTGHWHHPLHQHSHALERAARVAKVAGGEEGSEHLTLGDFTLYCDSSRQQLVLMRQREGGRRRRPSSST